MSGWQDASVFFLPPVREADERWFRGLSATIGLHSDGYLFQEKEKSLPGRWANLDVGAQLISRPAGSTLVISYFSRDFYWDVAKAPDRWVGFCHVFAWACVALSPFAAVALDTISDDILRDVRIYEEPVAEVDGARLLNMSYALLYLGPELNRAALEKSPPWGVYSHLLSNGGRVASSWQYDEFPE
ncbi:hypothetical protein [Nonomuraea sp. NPDC049784]|uniref:hypothetical protein n=1 Tax=Nonomuraea sp. NPDC049784 TaxID=3154361 RepID=UPI0033C88B1C